MYKPEQEAWDSVTRVTMAIKSIAVTMLRQGKTTAQSELAKQGLNLCQEIVPASMNIEELLYKEKASLKQATVLEAVARIEDPYKALLKYYNDLVKVVKGSLDVNTGTPLKFIKFKAVSYTHLTLPTILLV